MTITVSTNSPTYDWTVYCVDSTYCKPFAFLDKGKVFDLIRDKVGTLPGADYRQLRKAWMYGKFKGEPVVDIHPVGFIKLSKFNFYGTSRELVNKINSLGLQFLVK